jgi:hypothetical protein
VAAGHGKGAECEQHAAPPPQREAPHLIETLLGALGDEDATSRLGLGGEALDEDAVEEGQELAGHVAWRVARNATLASSTASESARFLWPRPKFVRQNPTAVCPSCR